MSAKNLLRIIVRTLRGAARTGIRTPDLKKNCFYFSGLRKFWIRNIQSARTFSFLMSAKNLLRIIVRTFRGAARTGIRTPDLKKNCFYFSGLRKFWIRNIQSARTFLLLMSAKNLLKIIVRTLRGAARTLNKLSNFPKKFSADQASENFKSRTFTALELFRFRCQRKTC